MLLLRARGGESRFAQMLMKKGYFCAQYPQFIETPLPFGEHVVTEKIIAAQKSRLVDAKAGIPAIAVSDTVALDSLIKIIKAHADTIPLAALPFRLVLIGDKALRYSEQVGLVPSLGIPGFCDQALSAAADQLAPLDVMLLTSDKPPKNLVAALTELTKRCEVAKVFARCRKLEPPPLSLAIAGVISCTSTALSRDIIARLDPEVLTRPFFAIGPKTAEAARKLGFSQVTTAKEDNLPSLFALIAGHFGPPLLGRAL